MIVAIHQPNFLPWLGYFDKIARADLFVFLDNAQFTKNSYINRVRIMGPAGPRWLTVPVKVHLGDPINAVRPAIADWAQRHIDSLAQFYRNAAAFKDVWPTIQVLFAELPDTDIAAVNQVLVERCAARLGITSRFRRASDLDTGKATGDDRLIALVKAAAPGATYLHGAGGTKYQNPETFAAAGVPLQAADFEHPVYHKDETFTPGLSVLDAAFHLGWAETAALLDTPHRA